MTQDANRCTDYIGRSCQTSKDYCSDSYSANAVIGSMKKDKYGANAQIVKPSEYEGSMTSEIVSVAAYFVIAGLFLFLGLLIGGWYRDGLHVQPEKL